MKFPYNETVLEHFKNPRNVGRMEEPDGKATEGSPACGDLVAVYIKVDEETKTISDVKFESYGCASNIATASIITELAKGKTLEEAKKITWQNASDALGGLPPIKVHCSVLAVDGLRAAIENYEEKHGLIKEREETNVEIVMKRLKRVMNPTAGLDIVRTNLVSNISVKEKVIKVNINLTKRDQFANAIKEDIVDKLATLWDIEKVEVELEE